jgi:hypothetical protein
LLADKVNGDAQEIRNGRDTKVGQVPTPFKYIHTCINRKRVGCRLSRQLIVKWKRRLWIVKCTHVLTAWQE